MGCPATGRLPPAAAARDDGPGRPCPRGMNPTMRLKRPVLPLLLLAGLLPALLGGCATRPPADDPDAVAEFRQNNDPIEPFNRRSFAVHQTIDRYALEPVARGYR